MAAKARNEAAARDPLVRTAVKKNVAAIHVSGKLTLLQRKLSNVLLLNAYDHLITRQKHSIDARTLCLMIGYNSNDMDTLKDALRSLAETVAEWDMLNEQGQQEWGVSALLAFARLKGGVCEYSYSSALAEKLHDPKVFALINLNIQRRFTSGHALALYENCFRFIRTGSTGWWPLDLFRRLMGVDGSAYYESFKQLNAKIIKPAVAEVNRNSNIIVTAEFRRQGRAVSEIRFLIRENPQLAMFDIDDGEGVRGSDTYKRLVGMGVSDRLARQWIAEHGAEHVRYKLDYVAGQGGVKSPVRYLAAALRDDYAQAEAQPAAPSPEALASAEARRAQAARAAEAQARREADVALARRSRAERMARVREFVAQRDEATLIQDSALFLTRLEGELERADFARHGWASALNTSAICAYWEDVQPGLFDDL
ncbi:replication initiator protein [Roseinatronobacter thiooxidans]|uniref:Replication initiator protein n=1 Tax=Roseinatronobacter thiooxidans TaxID=121821 RepID=A0A2W7PPR1_9RHOB|nr:replication initiation protein [Roseinatronobacter thiooxidans]PZX38301.1 replication initiator protein [Roseinatronobacter thiooxidans]